MLQHIDETILFFVAVAAFLVVIEIGFRWGSRHRTGHDDATKSHMTALQGGLLGMLSLLLGFNFAMASSRFDARKALIQDEINAIGTAYSRSQLLPRAKEFKELLSAYVGARTELLRAGMNDKLTDAANADASRIDAELWAHAKAMTADNSGGPLEGLFVQALNDMNNVKWKRYSALDNHVPEPVIGVLFMVAVGALGFIAYGYGLTGRRRHGSTAIFAVLIALVLSTILDLDRPHQGIIRVGEEGMLRLQASLQANPS